MVFGSCVRAIRSAIDGVEIGEISFLLFEMWIGVAIEIVGSVWFVFV